MHNLFRDPETKVVGHHSGDISLGNSKCIKKYYNYEYDPLGNLTKTILGEGTLFSEQEKTPHGKELRVTTYQRDQAGQVTQITDALGNSEHYSYDHSGKLIQKKDKDGYHTSYHYTNAGDPNRITYADGREVKLSYNPLRRLIQMEDWLGITRIENDALGRAVKVTDHKNREISYSWGPAGERESITYPDGKKVHYGYDAFLRLKEVKDGDLEVSYTYDALGYLREKTFPNGQKTMYDYSAAGQLQSLRHFNKGNEFDHYEYEYDSIGNKVGMRKRRSGLQSESGRYQYGYDPLNRLQEVIKDGRLLRHYTYDSYGNRTGLEENQKSTQYVYNALNQLVSKADSRVEGYRSGTAFLEETYGYDKRGNLTEVYKNGKLINQYHFGALNRLEKAVNHVTGMGAAYTYNGLGHRVGKVEGNPLEPVLPTAKLEEMSLNPTKQIDDVLDITKQYHNLLQRHEDNHTTSFLWDNHVLSANGEDGTTQLYFHDDLGSPIRLRDADGRDRQMYGYDEFGNDLYNKKSIVQPFGYTGYQKDTVANTYYAQAREYRPETGRFISEDIIQGLKRHPVTMNHYSYCFNSLIVFTDLTGAWPIFIAPERTQKIGDAANDVVDWVGKQVDGIIDTVDAAISGVKDKIKSAAEAEQKAREELGKIQGQEVQAQKNLPGKVGILGNMEDNGCGIISIYNAEVILGNTNITLADAAAAINGNPLGPVAGGLLGTNPFAVEGYFAKQGYHVKWITDLNNVSKDAAAYIILYAWYNGKTVGAHYQAASYDENGRLITINLEGDYADFTDFYKNNSDIFAMMVLEISEQECE